jgi:indolepyruvate ferredoxin oxidoreductase alpha subunit
LKKLLSGNEAIARGIWEAGVNVASGYPGTPSTEILENLATYDGLYCEWSVNEKVALEVALGATVVGARAFCTMKLVGLNVAADPLFNAVYSGVKGGLVVLTADDPSRHSSQTEQDNRNYARFARLPVMEPADSQEAKDFVAEAMALSEAFGTPVLYRTETRISHSKSLVELEDRVESAEPFAVNRDLSYCILPAFTRTRHAEVEERIRKIGEWAETWTGNRLEMRDPEVGIITCGVTYQYVREAMPEASTLKIGMPYPLPRNLIASFASQVKKLYVVEELDPFLEEQIRLMGIEVAGGKDLIPLENELNPRIVAAGLARANLPVNDMLLTEAPAPAQGVPPRPPTLCPGCGHRGVFVALNRLKAYVTGDIGCYTLGALPPFSALHSVICMGAGVSMAHGMDKGLAERMPDKAQAPVVGVVGDSTFFHSCIPEVLNTVWNNGTSVLVVLDNRTTAMTGGQVTPGQGCVLCGQEAPHIDIAEVVKALKVPRVRKVDPYNLKEVEEALKEEIAAPEASVIIAEAPCVLEYKIKGVPYMVDAEACTGCKRCLRVGCTALSLTAPPEGKDKDVVVIDPAFCTGCSICAQMCRFEAILPGGEN